MLIAHFPSGYLLGAALQRNSAFKAGSIMIASLFGNVAPDLDMIYFHLVDGRNTHHHDYFTYWPLFWLAVGVLPAMASRFTSKVPLRIVLAFRAGTMLHLVLDTIAAPMRWLMPFNPQRFELVNIPATYSNWVMSFIFHWTFALEIVICLAAIGLFFLLRHISSTISVKMT